MPTIGPSGPLVVEGDPRYQRTVVDLDCGSSSWEIWLRAGGGLSRNPLQYAIQVQDCCGVTRKAHLFGWLGRFPSASSPGTGPPKVCLSLRRSPDFQASMICLPFSLILMA